MARLRATPQTRTTLMPRDSLVSSERYTLGVDVAKYKLDCSETPGRSHWHLLNKPNPIAELVTQLRARLAAGEDVLVVVEASGGCERLLCEALWAAGIPIHLANPKRVRDYAKAIGRLAKTDKVDAAVLASFGQNQRPNLRPTAKPDARLEEIGALASHRRRLVEEAVARKNALKTAMPQRLRLLMEQELERLGSDAKEILAGVKEIIASHQDIATRYKILKSFCGIGEIAGAELIAYLPELGKLDRRQIAAIAGLAPIADDSGRRNGKRFIKGGRPEVRRALYMPAVTALTSDPGMRAFHQQLIARGKPQKLAITAVMRKLLIHINAACRQQLKDAEKKEKQPD